MDRDTIYSILLVTLFFGILGYLSLSYQKKLSEYENEYTVVCYEGVNGTECQSMTDEQLLEARL